MRGTIAEPTPIHARLKIPADQLGLQAPPVDCHLRAMAVENVWVLYLWGPTQLDPLLEWLRDHGSFEERENLARDQVLAVQTPAIPQVLTRIFGEFDVETFLLRTHGVAEMSLKGSRDRVRALVDLTGGHIEHLVQAPSSTDSHPDDPLTETEREALLTAYRAGYFEVPREVRLAELSEQMGKSTGALSAVLRRAVLTLVEGYTRRHPPSQAELPEEESREAIAEKIAEETR